MKKDHLAGTWQCNLIFIFWHHCGGFINVFVIVCSTTLWVGHLSKLVHQEELSDNFGEYGDIVSIDLIPPRGCAFICMNRRQDAYRALSKLKNYKLQGKAITVRSPYHLFQNCSNWCCKKLVIPDYVCYVSACMGPRQRC